MKQKYCMLIKQTMKLVELVKEFRQDGEYSYDELDNNAKDFSYPEKLVALSGYFDKYVLMPSEDLRKELRKRQIPVSKNDAKNVITLTLDDEEETLFKIIDMKNKTDLAILLKAIIVFPKEFQEMYPYINHYSLRNISLIILQVIERDLYGPIKTYKQWRDEGVQVKKGEKGIGIIVPNTVQRRRRGRGDNVDEETFFNFRRRLFAQSQTDHEVPTEIMYVDFDMLADKHGIDPDLSEKEILEEIVDMYGKLQPELNDDFYNLLALITGNKTRNIYATIDAVNNADKDRLTAYVVFLDYALRMKQ